MKKYKKLLLIIFFTCFLTSCTTTRWYKPGAGQWDFDKDEQECLRIAHKLAKEATIGGKKEDLEVFLSSYQRCLYQKGWSPFPIQNGAKEVHTSPLGVLKGDLLSGLGVCLNLPHGFVLIRDNVRRFGPTIIQSFFFKGPMNEFLNIIFQKSKKNGFKKIPYKVSSKYYIYDRYYNKKQPLTWTIYFGKFHENWVKCIGAIYYLSKHKRIIVVITSPLPKPIHLIPGLGYSRSQIIDVKDFSSKWTRLLLKNIHKITK